MKNQQTPVVIEGEPSIIIELIEKDRIATMSVQKANDEKGMKISIAKELSAHLGVEIGDSVWEIKAMINGRPAIVVTKPRFS
ncbi:MAG: hypothetical protein KGN01_07470 [Patescibacteria group bacterium]|nr:hypothetical protein [Patescibacteria group bacterium]